ncbi:hypothetical protein AB0C52_05790 [Streptomyces sp. NPDC048717]|uniref:hypothetical protein n=1 Tax=Streptomyces sp. NPDC048717 TaxID=3154928 RepID=UPI00342757C3
MTHSGQGPEQQYPAAQPLPPEVTPGGSSDAQATQYLPPIPGAGAPPQPGYGYPHPHAAPQQGAPQPGYGYPHPAAPVGPDAQSTQYLPPVPAAQDNQAATQYLPPVPAAQDNQAATQYLPPVPQQGPPQGQPPQGPPQGPPPGAVPPPHATQERPPLADFDNLFRSDTPRQAPQTPPPGYGYPHPQAAPPAGPPRQQPGYGYPHPQTAAPAPQQQPYGGYQDSYQPPQYAEPEPPRRKPPVKLIAAVVAGCAAVGLGAGALLSGGGGDDKKDTAAKDSQNVAAGSPAPPTATEEKPSEPAPVDPVKTQAEGLDKLLADSNSSRDAVIRSVELIKRCDDLDQAATDLRGAAAQRRGLVTRLQALPVDKIPNNAALKVSLIKAWQASAAADDYYAGWAVQAKKNHKVCKGGHASATSQSKAGDRKSGEATAAKKEASGLWNPTADKYELTRREWSQL